MYNTIARLNEEMRQSDLDSILLQDEILLPDTSVQIVGDMPNEIELAQMLDNEGNAVKYFIETEHDF